MSPKAPETTVELTLTLEGNIDPAQLKSEFSPSHVYGPVESLTIRRKKNSIHRNFDVVGVEVDEVEE